MTKVMETQMLHTAFSDDVMEVLRHIAWRDHIAEIVLAKANKVLSIPESAIEFSGDSTFVYIVKGEGEKKTYDRRAVTTGLSDGVNIEIKKGITAKDKVRGPQQVADTNEKPSSHH